MLMVVPGIFQEISEAFLRFFKGYRDVLGIIRGLLRIQGYYKGAQGIAEVFQGFSKDNRDVPAPGDFRAFQGCNGDFRTFQECSRGSHKACPSKVQHVPNGFKRFQKSCIGVPEGFRELQGSFRGLQEISESIQGVTRGFKESQEASGAFHGCYMLQFYAY